MKTILYEQSDSTIAIVNLANQADLDSVFTNDIPQGVRKAIIDSSLLPPEADISEFSEAMRFTFHSTPEEYNVYFDIQIAREVTKRRLRIERKPLFEVVDIRIRDAMLNDDKDELAKAIAERDRLRDITKLPDQVFTLDGLRQLHP